MNDFKLQLKSERIDKNELQLLSIPEACKLLGIGSWAMYQQINRRSLKTIKIGGRRLVSVRALNEFVETLEK